MGMACRDRSGWPAMEVPPGAHPILSLLGPLGPEGRTLWIDDDSSSHQFKFSRGLRASSVSSTPSASGPSNAPSQAGFLGSGTNGSGGGALARRS